MKRSLRFLVSKSEQGHVWNDVIQEAIKRGERVRTEGPDFRFYNLEELPKVKTKSFFNNKGMIGVLLALIVFTIIFVFAYLAILCDW